MFEAHYKSHYSQNRMMVLTNRKKLRQFRFCPQNGCNIRYSSLNLHGTRLKIKLMIIFVTIQAYDIEIKHRKIVLLIKLSVKS